jgi:hypothetical protein
MAYAVIPVVVGIMGTGAAPQSVLVLITWSVIWMGWLANLFGEADAKVLMALIALWPDRWMVGFLIAGHVLWSAYHLVQRYRSGALQVALAGIVSRPTEQELDAQGVPTIPAYAAAGWGYFVLRAIEVF